METNATLCIHFFNNIIVLIHALMSDCSIRVTAVLELLSKPPTYQEM